MDWVFIRKHKKRNQGETEFLQLIYSQWVHDRTSLVFLDMWQTSLSQWQYQLSYPCHQCHHVCHQWHIISHTRCDGNTSNPVTSDLSLMTNVLSQWQHVRHQWQNVGHHSFYYYYSFFLCFKRINPIHILLSLRYFIGWFWGTSQGCCICSSTGNRINNLL